tara:strand:+ start:78 stop:308 length:231 start_codon:yes stop_codon:yes gene_type:complete
MSYSTLDELRTARNTKLANTDKFFRPDIYLDDSQKQQIIDYCSILRDITSGITEDNVSEVTLPEPPQLPYPYNNYF